MTHFNLFRNIKKHVNENCKNFKTKTSFFGPLHSLQESNTYYCHCSTVKKLTTASRTWAAIIASSLICVVVRVMLLLPKPPPSPPILTSEISSHTTIITPNNRCCSVRQGDEHVQEENDVLRHLVSIFFLLARVFDSNDF